ncbi:peptidoglycan DD-metalloendopeptidase family protein [Gracilimonas tropica]|uniref:peptidoglycan DD-metalloendopeptidase family protein n=1 Tax=Gracilimonas tropica TaxID=454600 RepID=UPI000360B0C2|nr:peptidoglycan DD-metalloendopeptidase family protein [Gracilimonas tropica]
MSKKNLLRGIGISLCLILISVAIAFQVNKEKPIPNLTISSENMVEITEDVELDSYGFNRMNMEVEEGKVKRNESLYLILRDLDVSPQTIYEINQKSKGIFQSNRVKPGQKYLAYKNEEGAHRLILHANSLEYVVFDWEDDISVSTGRKEITTKIAQTAGVIESSLYETLMEKDVSTLLGLRLSEIFAWQIDFFRLYPGDHFKVIYEEQFVDGEFFGIGDIVAAEFTSKDQSYDAFYYDGDETAGFYDSEGNGVQKALLKAPFKFSQRISSGFSHNRFHPVLKRRIPHYGVDYAAPQGTPVLSVGDGEIIEAQYRGANGNIVKVRHNSTYTTAYLHLNGFARGIRSGMRVKQGQVIGYVGKTGRVTGVHLDYRIYKNGQPVNPLTVDLPPSKALQGEDLDTFRKKVKVLQERLSLLNEEENPSAVASL